MFILGKRYFNLICINRNKYYISTEISLWKFLSIATFSFKERRHLNKSKNIIFLRQFRNIQYAEKIYWITTRGERTKFPKSNIDEMNQHPSRQSSLFPAKNAYLRNCVMLNREIFHPRYVWRGEIALANFPPIVVVRKTRLLTRKTRINANENLEALTRMCLN